MAATSTAVYKYRVFCRTEGAFQYVWAPTAPTCCPNNSQHDIDTDTITVIDSVRKDVVMVKDTNPMFTQEMYIREGYQRDIAASNDTCLDVNFPIPVEVYGIYIKPTQSNISDVIDAYHVIANIACISVDNQAMNFTTTQPLSNVSLPRGAYVYVDGVEVGRIVQSTPTSLVLDKTIDATLIGRDVEVRVYVIKNVCIMSVSTISIGKDKLGGTVVPANDTIHVHYTNTSSEPKTFCFDIQYIY